MALVYDKFYSFFTMQVFNNLNMWNIFVSLATKDANNSLRDHFQDLLSRDQRRFWYADTNRDKMLSEHEFHLFVKPKQYKEMMELMAYVSQHFDLSLLKI